MRYCVACERMVRPIKHFSWAAFLLLCLTMIGGVFYLLYYWIMKKKECPICRGKDFMKREPSQTAAPDKTAPEVDSEVKA